VGVQRILVISLVVMFMVHLMACIFFLVSKFEDEDRDNWAIYAGINDEIDSY
jgi:flagellar basal body-associated protein FliL